ncbi:MAG: hypothetical protein WBD00_04840, partial [Candidatus Omnitrophota bacterium]
SISKLSSADTLAVFASNIMDMDIENEETKKEVRRLVLDRLLKAIRKRGPDADMYVNVALARVALKDGALDDAFAYIDEINVEDLDLTNSAHRDILIMRARILNSRLTQEAGKPVRNAQVIANINAEIDSIRQMEAVNRLEMTGGVPPEDVQRLQAQLVTAAATLSDLESKRKAQAETDRTAAESAKPGEKMVVAEKEKEEQPEEDKIKALERRKALDEKDMAATLELGQLYAGKGEFDKAKDALSEVLKTSKDKDQVAQAAEGMALISLRQDEIPARSVLRKIPSGANKDIIVDVISVRKGGSIEVPELMSRIEGLIPEGEIISDRAGRLMSIAAATLADNISTSGRRAFRDMRAAALSQLEQMKAALEGREFESDAVKEAAQKAVDTAKLERLAKRVAEDVRKRTQIDKLRDGIEKVAAQIVQGVKKSDELARDIRKATRNWYQSWLMGRRAAKKASLIELEEQKQSEILNMKRKTENSFRAAENKAARGELAKDLVKADGEYINAAGKDKGLEQSRCIEVIDEIVGLLNEYGSDKAVREALMPKLNQFISRYVTLANEIAGSNAPEEPDESAAYKNWRNLLPVSTE